MAEVMVQDNVISHSNHYLLVPLFSASSSRINLTLIISATQPPLHENRQDAAPCKQAADRFSHKHELRQVPCSESNSVNIKILPILISRDKFRTGA